MYESHFGFHRQPFQCADLARAFLVSESIRRILPQLLHALRSDLGIAVLTGPSGAGKSSVLRHLQSVLRHDGRILICSGSSLETTADVLLALKRASQLKTGEIAPAEIPDDGSRPSRWAVVEQMRKTIEFWGPVLLLVDDAQLLSVPILNELRAFSEEEWNGRGLVRILVSGPLAFEEDLARPACSDFSRRIRCHAFLQPLTTQESIEFLMKHVEAAGGRVSEVFDSAALELIVSACDGLPRCLSLLADESLVVAAELAKKKADNDCVQTALTRLQHLPYPWNASTVGTREDFLFEQDLTEHADRPGANPAAPGPALARSQGVIEFGAPGVVEFGGSPLDSSLQSATEEAACDVEVGDPGADDVGADENFGYTAATWVPLECHVQPEDFPADANQSPIRSTSCITFFGNVATEERESTPAAVELASHSVGARDSDLGIANQDSWERTPVFDRYTWIALGRDAANVLPPSGVTLPLVDAGDLISETWNSAAVCEPVTSAARNMIHVTRTTDDEICRLLSRDESALKSGDFFAFRSLARLTPSTPEAGSDRPWDDKNAAPECSAEEIEGTDESESSWFDGQLIFGLEASDDGHVANDADSTESVKSDLDTEQVSLSFEAARSARTEVDPAANEENVIEVAPAESEAGQPKREMFFTLPADVRSIEWDLRTEMADPDGVFPLAESLASLRDEVTSFQKNIRIEDHSVDDSRETQGEAVGPPRLAEESGDPAGCDHLVARARRQLEGLPTYRAADIQLIADHRTFVSVSEHKRSPMTAEELSSAAVPSNNGLPNFGQLFTRLRQKRQQSVENDSR